MLFKSEHVDKILNGEKTQTRRLWKKRRALVGSIHQARTQLFGEPFALLKILEVYQERLIEISDEDLLKEGGYNFELYREIWKKINGSWDDLQIVWVVEFEVFAENKSFELSEKK